MGDQDQWWKVDHNEQHNAWQELKTPEGLTYYYNVESGVTQWDKPDALKSENELSAAGDWVWAPHDALMFVPARITSRNGNMMDLQTQDGEYMQLKSNVHLDPVKLSSLQRIVDDLVLADNMSTPLILHILRARFEQGKIYTNIGTILISINPYQMLGLYTPQVIDEYINRGVKEMKPHVFNIAHDAYIGIKEFKENQSIIISGESGAGKTEATKQCLAYVSAIAGSVGNIEQKILQANPILESFGNAKTLRNDNSSRFGKYMEVFFDQGNTICGSLTTNYLLEKVRVVQQQQGERNFHIFYQLTKAADGGMRKKFSLGNPRDYRYLALSQCWDVSSINDNEEFQATKSALAALDFSQQDIMMLFGTTSAVLAMGNIEFRGGGNGSKISDPRWLKVAANLLMVDTKYLAKVMTIRELRIRNQATTEVLLDPKQAADTRDALSKFIYVKMFDWIVQKVNQSMKTQGNSSRMLSMGILDIFGFEIFEQNSFEQLCINFTNEMLQQHFNNQTFKLEEQLYKSENIRFQHVEFIDNQPVLDLISKKPYGIMRLLDEELIVPQGSDKGFLQKIHKAHSGNQNFQAAMASKNYFVVVHYAGVVTYDAMGFLEKNRDTLTDDLIEMLHSSKSRLVNEIFPKSAGAMSTKDRKSSLGYQFTAQLLDLMQALNKTEPHYIRCVKPNDTKSQLSFIPRMCLEQLTYAGVFEAVSIRKQGFPFRLKHNKFVDRYKVLCSGSVSNNRGGITTILKEMRFKEANVQIGRTMVLYRSEEHKMLELQRSIKVVAIEMSQDLNRLVNTNYQSMDKNAKERYFQELAKVVRKANAFRLRTDIANRARQILDDYIESRMDPETKRALEEAKKHCEQGLLEKAVRMADAKGYNTRLCRECRALLKRVKRINEEVDIVSRTLEERVVEICVQAADEIGMTGDWIDYFRGLVHGPKGEFIDAQFKAAVDCGQHDRAIRIGVRRKDLLFQEEGQRYQLSMFPGLKSPMEWAAQKFFGSKEERARTMLQWQPTLVHAPLCKYDHVSEDVRKENKKKAVRSFKYIMKYMGQRKTKVLIQRSREMMEFGLKYPAIRNEIYIGLCKQLTNNPEPEAMKPGWDLMGLCLNAFPPAPDFENYLEVWLRQNARGNLNYKFTGWLRKRCMEGAIGMIYSDSEIQGVEMTLNSRSRGFSEPLPPGQPSYHDLTQPFTELADLEADYTRATPKGNTMRGGGGGGRGGGRAQLGGGRGPGPRKAKKAPKKHAWVECVDDASGDTYYYNEETQESSWDRPPELAYAGMGRKSVGGRGW